MYMMNVIFFFLFSTAFSSTEFDCSIGCADDCLTNYTCSSCLIGYDDDGSCVHCQLIDTYQPFSDSNPLYVRQDDNCQKN
ncbi:hypothetical protein QTN25_001745 [Entamoeba marina]